MPNSVSGVCNPEEVYEIFFGTEEDPEANFIQLKDCGHVFEVSGMDMWMMGSDDSQAVKFKECPRCKVAIR